MAIIIPTVSSCSEKITAGEKRLARLLERGLSDSCTCWYDTPMGKQHSHPDFVILTPTKVYYSLKLRTGLLQKSKVLIKHMSSMKLKMV